MKQVKFTYLNKKFTLDLEKGELLGDDEIIKQKIIDGVNGCKNHRYGGAGSAFYAIMIDNPFYFADQFSMAFYYGVNNKLEKYPKELHKYLPKYKESNFMGATKGFIRTF